MQRDVAPTRTQAPLAQPADMLLSRLLYRDGLMLIINKPAGLPVHAGPKGGENLEDYLDALRFGLPDRPHLAHRLDRDTSGCLVLGRHRKALRRLGKLFESRQVRKTYWAIAEGALPKEKGRIEAPLAKRSTAKRGWWMKVDPDGQRSVTDYRVLDAAGGLSLVELSPRTGRTHQLRVHLAHLGCPIVGDHVYGSRDGEKPMLLHAKKIVLPLYPAKPAIEVQAPLPAVMQEFVDQLTT